MRDRLQWASEAGFRSVALDAATPGLRPRELDRSGRRDAASLLKRLELGFAGVDLLIPKSHFIDAERSDRALAAAMQALAFASEMSRLCAGPPVLTLELPRGADASAVRSAVAAEADRVGARIADLGWPPLEDSEEDLNRIGVGLDPAAALLGGADPCVEAIRLGARLLSARVSDLDASGRTTPGDGGLDLRGYAASLTTAEFNGDAVLDLRGLRNQADSATTTRRRWGGPTLRD